MEAGVDPSTLTRFLSDVTNSRMLNSYSIEKIEQAGGIPAFQTDLAGLPEELRGTEAGDASPYQAEEANPLATAISALRSGKNGVDPWLLRSRCLENVGYVPGDILIVDLNAVPANGDIVCAQLYDRNGKAETIFRIFEHPFLISATMDPAQLMPVLVDKNVLIRGVVMSSIRERRAA
ncbi:hypothetical protein [Rhizobium sp. PL01]|uniref:LexA family protein n=1 Tax=Rhizobium sp. PL01 TaxID=3085631 RepID=UPI0029811690|nr:hypothetical protein [Rhizobium sp. PL01]MDW5313756.1 hypothetical protein [Rhizobium sp. PL01]